jgi:hypothetical protein
LRGPRGVRGLARQRAFPAHSAGVPLSLSGSVGRNLPEEAVVVIGGGVLVLILIIVIIVLVLR